ncbi:helix-turn-helix transcriptional regulator [Niastella sp. OAS944]|uniref:helix-turn-helix transcriptional regulator n=1 Tax=Niastella sp. OAS944 TaxID=2664089 RepID=UPI003470A871|nr:AraC-like DNA-binding protein [Chitinophagaceae bacterium OAS944]
MKSYSIRISKIDRDDAFKDLAYETGGELEESNTMIKFSGELGRGQIKRYHLDAGLYMRVWDLFLVKPLEIIKEAMPMYIADNGFGLLYIQTPESVDLKSINEHQQYHKVRERRFALAPESVNGVLQLHPQLPIRFIDFTISAYWLKQQPGYIHVARYFNDGIMDENVLPVLIEACQAKANALAGKLIDCIEDRKADPSAMLPVAEALIKEFLTAASKESNDKTHNHIDLYYDKVKEAEAILIANLQKSPPRLSAIAKTLALSESTLKRYFKIIYGKSIYEYYLNRKMELARTLMMQRPHTVNEIAELMGYEKVSHFIEIFKKHHGFSPGSIKKKQLELLSS